MNVNEIFSVLDVIEQSIKLAELDTSAEFKVHIEKTCVGDPNIRAKYVFDQLNLQNTKNRNAVLIYVAFESLKFSIIHDIGIEQQMNVQVQEEAKRMLLNALRDEKIAEGIMDTIQFLGKKIGQIFPFHPSDINELPDNISVEH